MSIIRQILIEQIIKESSVSESYLKKAIEFFKKQNPQLTDQIITHYVTKYKQNEDSQPFKEYEFEKKKENPKFNRKEITHYTFKELEEIIDSNFTKVDPSKFKSKEELLKEGGDDLIYNENNLIVLKGDEKGKCIRYGEGEKWCISRKDASNMFYTYRYKFSGGEPVFYFIYDEDKPKNDDKRILVLLVFNNGKYTLADRSNSGDFTGSKELSWEEVTNIQPKLKPIKHLLKAQPLTEREKKIYELIRKNTKEDNLLKHFKNYDILDAYVGFGHQLTDKQFITLPKDLRNKYLNSGNLVSKEIFENNLSTKEKTLYVSNMDQITKNDSKDLYDNGIIMVRFSDDIIKLYKKNILGIVSDLGINIRWIGNFIGGVAAVQLMNNEWNFINTKGEFLRNDMNFETVYGFSDGFSAVKLKNDEWNFINTKGEFLRNDMNFELVEEFDNGFVKVRLLNGGYNFINTKGEFLRDDINFKYVEKFNNGFAKVKLMNGEWNFINTKGEFVN